MMTFEEFKEFIAEDTKTGISRTRLRTGCLKKLIDNESPSL